MHEVMGVRFVEKLLFDGLPGIFLIGGIQLLLAGPLLRFLVFVLVLVLFPFLSLFILLLRLLIGSILVILQEKPLP